MANYFKVEIDGDAKKLVFHQVDTATGVEDATKGSITIDLTKCLVSDTPVKVQLRRIHFNDSKTGLSKFVIGLISDALPDDDPDDPNNTGDDLWLGGGGMNWRGPFDATKAYHFGDVVEVANDGAGISAGLWIANLDIPANANAFPVWPYTGTPSWTLLRFAPGYYHFKDVNDCTKKKMWTLGTAPVADV